MMSPTTFLSRFGKFALMPVGLLFLLGAAWSVSSTRTWIAHAIEVPGSVIEMVRERNSDNTGDMFAPVVRFKTVEGNTVEFESSFRSNPPAYRTGQAVSVLYDPAEPRSAAIRDFLSLWFMSLILGFIGAIFMMVGVAMVVISGWGANLVDGRASQPDPAAPSRSAASSR